MERQGIPKAVQESWSYQNLAVQRKLDNMFPALVQKKWAKSIKELDQETELHYQQTMKFYMEVRKSRNTLLHKGKPWRIPLNLSEGCVDNLWPLACIFVSLHNKFLIKPLPDQPRLI